VPSPPASPTGPTPDDEVAEVFRSRGPRGDRGHYESYFLKAASPTGDRAVWIRWTTHRSPGAQADGTLWLSSFERGRVRQAQRHGLAIEPLDGGGIALGAEARIEPGRATGALGPDDAVAGFDQPSPSAWDLSIVARDQPLHHLRPERLYRAPVPRTKLTSPYPDATIGGRATLFGEDLDLDGWRGMVGHNWGSEHAERWIWLHGSGIDGDPTAWVDVALARVRLGPVLTPWTVVGACSLGGVRRAIRGVVRHPIHDRADGSLAVTLVLRGGLRIDATGAADATATWTYHDPAGGERNVRNCSLATVELADRDRAVLRTETGALELGRPS
jgi:hypothetical protein